MDIIYFLIPLAMLLLAFAVAAFCWAVKSNQFDDLDREAYRILFEEDSQNKPHNHKQHDSIK
ncbi:unnamed protein product [marine sediment metagenome]|uniref:Cytochrome oxidase maturation protein cbb3-type n=1 Tax=marine sediment metagenome TaxID=412755 RepID=X1E7W1_9ZZZZ